MLSPLKNVARKLLNAAGLEVTRYHASSMPPDPVLSPFEARRKRFLAASAIDTVLDVGANEGQFALNLRRCGYAGRIVSFEPVPIAFAKLRDHAAGDSQWEVFNFAVGDINGSLEMNVSGTTDCSSFLDMADIHLQNYPQSAYVEK